MTTFTMNPVASEPSGQTQVRQWIEELTDYTPQQIDEVLEKMEEEQTRNAWDLSLL